MLLAVIAPEIIVAWAVIQWLVARRIAFSASGFACLLGNLVSNVPYVKEHKRSKTHGWEGLCNIMMVTDPSRFLLPRLRKGDIAKYAMTKDAIKDRSKGDLLSKGLAVLQTAWFILQCIVRKIQGLAVTELEIITLGFVALNFAMYTLWWNKPLDVRVPYVVCDESGEIEEGEDMEPEDIGWDVVKHAVVSGALVQSGI
jgi:hypothetical protein